MNDCGRAGSGAKTRALPCLQFGLAASPYSWHRMNRLKQHPSGGQPRRWRCSRFANNSQIRSRLQRSELQFRQSAKAPKACFRASSADSSQMSHIRHKQSLRLAGPQVTRASKDSLRGSDYRLCSAASSPRQILTCPGANHLSGRIHYSLFGEKLLPGAQTHSHPKGTARKAFHGHR